MTEQIDFNRNETKRMTNGRSHLRIQKVQAETMPINNVYLKLLLNYICCLCLLELENSIHSNGNKSPGVYRFQRSFV